jgi:hypothetical protein
MSDKVTVKVLLNQTSRFMAYSAGDRLVQALVFESGFPACGSVDRLLNIVFEQLNIDEPRADWAIRYRVERNRSLSVGDVVVVGEQAWAVDSVGWTPVSVEAGQVWYDVGELA